MIDPRRLEDDQLIALHGIQLPAHPNRAPQYTCRAQCPRRSPMTRTKALIHFRTDRHWTYWQGHVRMEAKVGRFNKGHSDSKSRPTLKGQEPKAGSRAGVVKGSISTKRSKASTSTARGDDLGHGQGRRASLPVVCDTSSPYNASDTSFYDQGIISSPLAEAGPSLRDPTGSAFTIPNPNLAARHPLCPPALSIDDEDDEDEDECECSDLGEGPTPPKTLAATEAYRHWAVVLGLGSHPFPLDSWVGPPRGASGGRELFQSWGWNVEELDAVKERRRREKKGESTFKAVGPRRPLEVIPEGHTIGEGDRAFKRSRGRFKKQSNNRSTASTPSNRQSLQTNPERRASWGRNASESGYDSESNLENEDYTRTPIPAQLNSKLQISPEVVHGALMGLVMMSRR
ncbi:BZ3500_MvSof-1268-A1-R1_Chr2-1g04343 [Microbotryum saponariae]|uniref:BZ3500_MvSof-1268-A1-R1_Chr2-1g04343 protein n=1 Tax=Microbotryum saponariae TaxID=289078 RepID=A0A2X0MB41_9BASI|nr:BZ3500_MvSof-1268-A1-R1_Chr2-1g04343 [Microbotryum saponariae]SCZ91494.1 BZ3501_MvSof-1269-A2-R1_Chr2-1g03999 [Microbotryum saponariae]